jgi:hypothetical protein
MLIGRAGAPAYEIDEAFFAEKFTQEEVKDAAPVTDHGDGDV